MEIRSYTFAVYNAEPYPTEYFLQVRCVMPPGGHMEFPPDRLWSARKLAELKHHPEVKEIVEDPRFDLTPPHDLGFALGTSEIVQGGDGVIFAHELDKRLGIRTLTIEEAEKVFSAGEPVKVHLRGPKPLDTGLRRLLGRRQGPFLRGGVGILETGAFPLAAFEVRTCTIRIACPAEKVSALHVEQWRVGMQQDRDRPVGQLLFLFAASEQVRERRARDVPAREVPANPGKTDGLVREPSDGLVHEEE